MSHTQCKATGCGWHTGGTSAGATSCEDMRRPGCLLSVVCSHRSDEDDCGHEMAAILAAYAGLVEEEWRVTGDPGREGYRPYEYVWRGPHAESEARNFVRLIGNRWASGPVLHHRTVTSTPWEEA